MLPFSHIPDPVLFSSSGYPLRIEAGLIHQLNTSVNACSTIFTNNKAFGRRTSSVHGRFRGTAGTTTQRVKLTSPRKRRGSCLANISHETG
jgi:hypothetical protein